MDNLVQNVHNSSHDKRQEIFYISPSWQSPNPYTNVSRKRLHPDDLSHDFKKLRLDPSVPHLDPPEESTPEQVFVLDEQFVPLANRIPDILLKPSRAQEEDYMRSSQVALYRPFFWKVLFDRLFYPELFSRCFYEENKYYSQMEEDISRVEYFNDDMGMDDFCADPDWTPMDTE